MIRQGIVGQGRVGGARQDRVWMGREKQALYGRVVKGRGGQDKARQGRGQGRAGNGRV